MLATTTQSQAIPGPVCSSAVCFQPKRRHDAPAARASRGAAGFVVPYLRGLKREAFRQGEGRCRHRPASRERSSAPPPRPGPHETIERERTTAWEAARPLPRRKLIARRAQSDIAQPGFAAVKFLFASKAPFVLSGGPDGDVPPVPCPLVLAGCGPALAAEMPHHLPHTCSRLQTIPSPPLEGKIPQLTRNSWSTMSNLWIIRFVVQN